MTDKKQIISYLTENKEMLHRNYNISVIGLFGSYARDCANEDSDIDLIIDFDTEVDINDTKNKVKELIKNKFNKEVDICRLKYLKSYARDKILNEIIYVR